MAGKIRWSRSDAISLGKTVASFNKTLKQLQMQVSDVILPDVLNYSELRSQISTRTEFNRIISSLRRFQDPSQRKIVTTEAGVDLTKWEFSELKKARRRATRRMSAEISDLSPTLGTGNTRINEINATIKSFENLETLTGKDFERIRDRILNLGVSDYEMKRAQTFQDNFIKAYSKMGRSEIVEFAKSFRNPQKFWEAIKDSELIDIALRYDQEEGLVQLAMDSDSSYQYELQKLGII